MSSHRAKDLDSAKACPCMRALATARYCGRERLALPVVVTRMILYGLARLPRGAATFGEIMPRLDEHLR